MCSFIINDNDYNLNEHDVLMSYCCCCCCFGCCFACPNVNIRPYIFFLFLFYHFTGLSHTRCILCSCFLSGTENLLNVTHCKQHSSIANLYINKKKKLSCWSTTTTMMMMLTWMRNDHHHQCKGRMNLILFKPLYS